MVDFTIFYILGYIIITIGLVFGVSLLRTKNIVKEDDIKLVSSLLNISINVVEEMGLVHEQEMTKIANIIILSLDNTVNIVKLKDKEKIIEQSKIFAYQLCENNKIELTIERKEIINQLIETVYNTKFESLVT